MSRTKFFLHGIVTGYAAIGVNIVYSLLSIPLALYYLGKEDFGLWILVVQLSGYLMLLDLGMIISVARFLADYKDNINGGDYGSVLKTGQAVLIIQAILVGFFGMLGLLVAPSLLHLPKEVTATFQILLGVQIFFVVLSFASRMVGSPLWCHQRYDITNLTASISLILNLFAMWIGFQCGMGVYSMLVGVAFSFVPSIGIPFWACRRLSFYPRRGCWGKFNYKLFKEIFYFGKDIFIISLGSQLTSASQVVLVSRVMGLEAASIWAVCTKSYIMGQQFISKIYDSAGGGLTELYVFGKKEIFTNRFQNIVSITAISAGFMAAAIFTFNETFVAYWTNGKIYWSNINNLLIGVLLFSTVLTRCYTGLLSLLKKTKELKIIIIFEGILFVLLGYILCQINGFSGILVASLSTGILITGVYAVHKINRFLRISFAQFLKSVIHGTILFISLGILGAIIKTAAIGPDQLLLNSVAAIVWAVTAVIFIWYISLEKNFKRDLIARMKLLALHSKIKYKP